MAFRDFTLAQLRDEFHLVIDEAQDLFASVPPVPVDAHLARTLAENVPLALAINTEKARSELIIAPMLVELRRLRNHRISLFSGIEFNVLPEKGLNGICDFLISRSTAQLFLRAPVVAVVEAKKEDIKGGLGQCVAEMVAAHQFNLAEGNEVPAVYGAVTSGSNWKFLKLEMPTVTIDIAEYLIDSREVDSAGRVLGVLSHMVGPAT